MKEKLNNALNDVSDKLIEEAAKADRLENNTARIVRNIAVPVASAAAIAGLCIGLAKMGVFNTSQGADLLPSSSTADNSGAGAVTSQINGDTSSEPYQYEYTGFIPFFSAVSDYDILSCECKAPELIFADSDTAIFTDGEGRIFYYSMAEKRITFSADIADTIKHINMITRATQNVSDVNAEVFTGEIEFIGGTAEHTYIALPYNEEIEFELGSGGKLYYYINTRENRLEFKNWDAVDVGLYFGLEDAPDGIHSLGKKVARIGETNEYVMLRNCTADYDLATQFDLQRIEIMKYTRDTVSAQPMDGGLLPFDEYFDDGYAKLAPVYFSGDGFTLEFDGYDCYKLYSTENDEVTQYATNGTYEVLGDNVILHEDALDFTWYFTADGSTLKYAEEFDEYMDSQTDHPASILNGKIFTEGEIPQAPAEELDIPVTGNSQAAFCDRVLEANRISALLDEYPWIFIDTEETNKIIHSIINEETPDNPESLFFKNDNEALNGVNASDDGTMYVVNSITPADENGVITKREYYIRPDTLLIDRIITYSADETDTYVTYVSTAEISYAQVEIGSKTEFCNKVYAANELSTVLENFSAVSVFSADYETNGDQEMLISRGDDLSETPNLLFSEDNEVFEDVYGMDDGSSYVITTVRASDEYDEIKRYYYIDIETLLINQIIDCSIEIVDTAKIYRSIGFCEVMYITEGGTADSLIGIENAEKQAEDVASAIQHNKYPYDGVPMDPNDMLWPLDREHQSITTYWGYDEWRGGSHHGIDVGSDVINGAEIYAPLDGRVIEAHNDGWNSGLGKWLAIDHGNGFTTVYAHCSEVTVQAGDYVTRGKQIATVGTTGWSTGPHLHFETRVDGVSVDPFSYRYEYTDYSVPDLNDVIGLAAAEFSGEYKLPENTAWCLDPEYTEISEMMYEDGGYYGHNGIDIVSPMGMPVYSVADGTVISAGWSGGYGNAIVVQHEGGYFTLYAHLSHVQVAAGDTVTAGQFIGGTGSTGFSTGNHLHLEVLKGTENIDPRTIFPTEVLDKLTYSENAVVFSE